jgi:hypothetical protein
MGIAILDTDKETANLLAELIAETVSPPARTPARTIPRAINPSSTPIAIISDEFVDVVEGTKQVNNPIEIIAIVASDGSACLKPAPRTSCASPSGPSEIVQVSRPLAHPADPAGSGRVPLVVADAAMARIMEVFRKVAPTQAPVPHHGGIGHRQGGHRATIHALSRRRTGPTWGSTWPPSRNAVGERALRYEKVRSPLP